MGLLSEVRDGGSVREGARKLTTKSRVQEKAKKRGLTNCEPEFEVNTIVEAHLALRAVVHPFREGRMSLPGLVGVLRYSDIDDIHDIARIY